MELQLNGFPRKKFVNQEVGIAQMVRIYLGLFVSLMYLVKVVKDGTLHVSCVFVLITLSGMEIDVSLVQEERFGLLERDVNAVKDNFSLAQDVKLLII